MYFDTQASLGNPNHDMRQISDYYIQHPNLTTEQHTKIQAALNHAVIDSENIRSYGMPPRPFEDLSVFVASIENRSVHFPETSPPYTAYYGDHKYELLSIVKCLKQAIRYSAAGNQKRALVKYIHSL